MANRRGGNRNKLVVSQAQQAVNQFKNEIAAELGIPNYDQIDKGALPSRINGMIGGTMVKRLIEMGEQALMASAGTGQSITTSGTSQLNPQNYVQDAMQDLQNAQQQGQGMATPINGGTVAQPLMDGQTLAASTVTPTQNTQQQAAQSLANGTVAQDTASQQSPMANTTPIQ